MTAPDIDFSALPFTRNDGSNGAGHDHINGVEHDHHADGHESLTPAGWPEPLAPAALHGLAGEFVHAIADETESDPVALLVQFLAGFGNAVGHSPCFMVEATPHFTNMFVLTVGVTSKSRKGTSCGHVTRVLGQSEPDWRASRIQSGLSSGEGLIEAVRDPQEDNSEDDDEELDDGVPDKRLLVVQGEFASVLAVMARAGNTLSSILRDAWDHGNLRTLCRKQNALRATGAHISILGHITRDEVRRNLTETELSNGFANRFLWVCVRRSKLLPEGGRVQLDSDLISKTGAAIEFSSKIKEMQRDDAARKAWRAVYPHLSRDIPGMLGSVTARAEAQVLRLSCIYALLDRSTLIREEHLRAALAVWTYAEQSAQYIFGDALGDPVADLIVSVLRERKNGMTRTEISELFGRNKSAERIQVALSLLLSLNKVQRATEKTGGRDREVWFAATKETN